jgi:hypothetical protein
LHLATLLLAGYLSSSFGSAEHVFKRKDMAVFGILFTMPRHE